MQTQARRYLLPTEAVCPRTSTPAPHKRLLQTGPCDETQKDQMRFVSLRDERCVVLPAIKAISLGHEPKAIEKSCVRKHQATESRLRAP